MYKQIDAIIKTATSNKLLHKLFETRLDSIELDSDKARELKSSYLKIQSLGHKDKGLDPPPKERVIHRLENFEAGNISTWWILTRELTLTPTSKRYGYEPLDITKLSGWKEASKDTRRRIIQGAKQYIEQQNNIATEWIGQNKVERAAFAGAQAFHLLSQEDPKFLENFPAKIWQKWASVILSSPFTNQHDNCYLIAVKYAYLNAPIETLETLTELIDIQNEKYGSLYVLKLISRCWDEQLELHLLEKAKDSKLKPNCLGQLIAILLESGSVQARELAKSLISWPLPLDAAKREKVFVTVRVLIEHESVWSWPFIWPLIQQDTAFGRKLLESVANGSPFGKYLDLNDKQLADLYIWLVKQYPYEEDPDHSKDENDDHVTTRDSIVELREGVLSQLRKRGTLESCLEIQRLIDEFPSISWLGKVLIDAQENMRRQTWKPPTPKQLLQIILEQDKRLVQSGHQLVDVLIESLQRLDAKLQGETPATRALWDKSWDKSSSNLFRPVDENDLSDYIKQFLDEDLKAQGIIINREVEVKRSYGKNTGARTDIHVDAVIKHPNGKIYDSITVIIEVKGCWHRDVKTAMKTQLVKRYLSENDCSHGLYLIGWFTCPQWDSEDVRYTDTPKMNLNEAKQYFDEQAKT